MACRNVEIVAYTRSRESSFDTYNSIPASGRITPEAKSCWAALKLYRTSNSVYGRYSCTRLQIIFIFLCIIITMGVQVLRTQNGSINDYEEAAIVHAYASISIHLADTIHQLQQERQAVVTYIINNRSNDNYEMLLVTFNNTGQAFNKLLANSISCGNGNVHYPVTKLYSELVAHRKVAVYQFTKPETEFIFYRNTIIAITNNIVCLYTVNQRKMWQTLLTFHMLLSYEEEIEFQQNIGQFYFIQGKLSDTIYNLFLQSVFASKVYIEQATVYSTTIARNISLYTSIENIQSRRQTILTTRSINASLSLSIEWNNLVCDYVELIYNSSVDVARIAIQQAADVEKQTLVLRSQTIALFALVIGMIIFLTIFVLRLLHNIQDYITKIIDKKDDVAAEKVRANHLLYQLLPPIVAERLKLGIRCEAETYDEVTVYNSDIVGFTEICHQSTAIQIVYLLNALYTLFDMKTEKYKVYKIETIGDAYIVVSGAPRRLVSQQHAVEIANFSLEICKELRNISVPYNTALTLTFRAGIHTGPCAVGVVGATMPRYCLFGETIVIASKMEATGRPDKVHISRKTKEALDQYGTFHITSDRSYKFANYGRLATYWLESKIKTSYQKASITCQLPNAS